MDKAAASRPGNGARRNAKGAGEGAHFGRGCATPASLEKLPSDERQECHTLWSAFDVRIVSRR
jgi:hypothetical protein